MGKLTQQFVDTAKPGSYGDGRGSHGLRLVVGKTSKSWIRQFTVDGKVTRNGLGSASQITLEEARRLAAEHHQGGTIDVASDRGASGADDDAENLRLRLALAEAERAKAEAEAEKAKMELELKLAQAQQQTPAPAPLSNAVLTGPTPPLAEIVERVIARKRPNWKGDVSESKWRSQLGKYCADLLACQVGAITPAMVMDCLDAQPPGIARRNKQRLSECFDFAVVRKYRTDNPATPVKLAEKPADAVHRKALEPSELRGAVAAFRDRKPDAGGEWPGAKMCLEFTALTACRSAEAYGAKWSEFDFDAAVWTIPGDRTKSGKQHRIPLSDAAIDVLNEAAVRLESNDGEIVFPTPQKKQMARTIPLRHLRRMGFDADVHGFRGSFSMWCAETGQNWLLAEHSLAHAVGSSVERSYQQSDLLEQRRPLMQEWADFLNG